MVRRLDVASGIVPAVVCALALIGAACAVDHSTRMRVEVGSELIPPDELDRIEITVDGADLGDGPRSAVVDLRSATLPGTLGITYGGDGSTLGPLTIVATGSAGGEVVAEDRAEASFVLGEEVRVQLFLARRCGDRVCEADERCVAGECVALAGDAGTADAGVADAGAADAGSSDGGSADAGAPDGGSVDAGPEGCVSPMASCDTASPDCETNLFTDAANCGMCGRDCAAAPDVGEGACEPPAAGESTPSCRVVACRNRRSDCDGEWANGCETDTRTDLAHCGGCDMPCFAGPNATAVVCFNGFCEPTACEPGFDDCDFDGRNGCECPAPMRCMGTSCR